MTYQSLNPATGKLLKKFDELTDKELGAKVATAATCFVTWRRKTYAERAVKRSRSPTTPTSDWAALSSPRILPVAGTLPAASKQE